MTVLSVAHRTALAHLVQACPDAALDRLAAALATVSGGRAGEAAAMLANERTDRLRRTRAFGPLLPLFRPREDGVTALTFPRAVLQRLWKRVSEGEAAFLPLLDQEGAEATMLSDRLCASAAAALRDHAAVLWPDAPTERPDDPIRPRCDPAELAACFDLAPLARRNLPLLPVWLERPDEGRLAELRLLIRDSDAVDPAGGRRMVDILFAHVADAERMLRIVTRTSKLADNDHLLSRSDMGVFVERLIASVNMRVEQIAAVRPNQGEAGVEQARTDLEWCAGVLAEMDRSLQLKPDSDWGRSARMARVRVAGQLSGLMQAASAAVQAALPLHRQTIAGRMKRMAPWLDAPAEGEAIETAAALLALSGAVRPVAAVFGCEADRSRLKSEVADYLSTYANEVLDSLNDGEVADPDRALRLVGVAARLLTAAEALEAARAVRRRASSAEMQRLSTGATPGTDAGASPTVA